MEAEVRRGRRRRGEGGGEEGVALLWRSASLGSKVDTVWLCGKEERIR
jgi:hypothetical protein